jgi:hypothetical protein
LIEVGSKKEERTRYCVLDLDTRVDFGEDSFAGLEIYKELKRPETFVLKLDRQSKRGLDQHQRLHS